MNLYVLQQSKAQRRVAWLLTAVSVAVTAGNVRSALHVRRKMDALAANVGDLTAEIAEVRSGVGLRATDGNRPPPSAPPKHYGSAGVNKPSGSP